MKEVDVALGRCASMQHALVHNRQAVELGLTRRQIQSRVAAGLLVPVHRGVYRIAGAPTTGEQSMLAAAMAAGPAAAASHRGAAWLWRFRGFDRPFTEIVVAGRQPSLAGVVVHRTRTLDTVDVSRACRIPVTTPARTLLDLGAVVPTAAVESALEDALMRRLVSLALLARTIERLGGPGRNGAGVLRGLVEERDPATAPTRSRLEDELLRVLRQGGLPEPVRQHEVAGVRLDFAYPAIRLAIEADSRTWHGGRLDVQRNSDKGNVLLARGWRVLHFTWGDVRRRAGYVVDCVARELALACPA
ncbi:MAG: type IV toxin-antitoxin system AbiEi family antitoxin domain-containing protein [Actinomycetota bacterium]|nr:type IV toxin-antitoxin system AbiEi family antitoxin domain-containing protein [Actinomycetota bacterium]